MAFNLGPFQIQLVDKLRTGFRAKYNLLLNKVIKDGAATENGFKLITHDGSLLEIDLLEYFYNKEQIDELFFIEYATEEEAGKIRIATMEEVIDGEDDVTVVTPYKLAQMLGTTIGRSVIAGEDLVAGDYVYLELPEEEAPEDPEEEPDLFPILVAKKAIATSLKTCVMGFIEEDALEGEETAIKFSGNINTYHVGLIPGQYYFLSDEDPSVLVPFPPSAPGSVQQIVGYAISELEIRVELHKPYLNWTDVFVTEFPGLYFEIGQSSTYSVLLTDYLAEYNVTANEEEPEDEDEDPRINTGYSYRFLILPEWVTTHTVVFDSMTLGGKPTKVGKETVFLEVTDRDKRTYLKEIYLYTAPPTKMKLTLRDTSGLDPVEVAEIFNGAAFKKPEFDFDIKLSVTGRHDGWYGKLTTPSDAIPATPDPYAIVLNTDQASYIIGENVEAEKGKYVVDIAVFRDIGNPDDLMRVKQEKINFSFYDEEDLAKVKFFLWDGENDVEIGPINPDGSSKFNVKSHLWDVRCNIDDIMHDEGLSILSSPSDPELDRFHYFLAAAAPLATYHQRDDISVDLGTGLFFIDLELFLTDQVTAVRDSVFTGTISFTINEKGIEPTVGVLKLGTIPDNTTNFNFIAELPATGGSFELPVDRWTILNDSESPLFNSDEWFLYRLIGSQLVNVDISAYTGNPQSTPYSAEGITQVDSFIFGTLGSKDIGKPSMPIHKTPLTLRAINRRRMDGEVVAIYQSDFSFGPSVPIEEVPIGGPTTGTSGIILKSGNGIFIAEDDEYNTINVLADADEFEFDDDPLAKVMRLKAGGVTLVHMDELPSLTVIGNMTAGVATPSAVSVITSTTLAGASHINLPTTLAVKTFVENTLSTIISGTTNFFAKFLTAATLGVGILSENGISVVANNGQFVSAIAPNVNPRGFLLSNSSSVVRWNISKSGLEPGDNSGSDFTLARFNDLGQFLGNAITVSRLTGLATFIGPVTITGSGVVISTTSTTLNPNFNADLLDSQHGTYYLDRANHTGTQLAATISDFAAAVRAVPLTGLVTSTSSTILATDSILVAFGKLQAQINTHTGAIGTGTVNYFPYYNTTTTFATSIMFQTASSVNVNGFLVLDIPTNANARGVSFQTGASTRWHIGKVAVETGSGDVGGDFALWAYSDAGSFKAEIFRVTRSTALMQINGTLTISTAGVVIQTTSTTLNPNFNADLLDSQHGSYYLSRANHTGTQLAATISDFSAAVRLVTLTGLSTSTNSPILATDTILQAFGKLQAQVTGVGASIGTGTVNYFPYYNTTTSLATSIMFQSSTSVTVAGFLVADIPTNANIRGLSLQTSATTRWHLGKVATETGSGDVGGDFALWAYSDAGAFKGEPFRISRSTLLATFTGTVTIGGSGVVISTSSTALNPNFNADLLDGFHGTYYLDRTNHTGTQAISTITNLQLTLDGKTSGSGSVGTIPKFTGTTTFGNSVMYESSGSIFVSGQLFSDVPHNSNVRGFNFQASGVARWSVGKAGTETGGNTGSDYVAWAYDDSGAFLREAFRISRANGNMTLAGGITVSGGNSGQWNTAYGWGNHAGLYAPLSHTHTASQITDFTSAARGTISAGTGISYNSSTGVISYSGSTGISGSGTNTYFGVWTGSSSMGISVVRDTGSEINIGSGRSFGVEGPAAMRDYLHVWGYQANGTASNHGTLILHNLSSATINGAAAIEILSTTRGFLNARMTQAQRLAITGTDGLVVYQTNAVGASKIGLKLYSGGTWYHLVDDAASA